MKYALAVIEIAISNLKINEPIRRSEGNLAQADTDLKAIDELSTAKKIIEQANESKEQPCYIDRMCREANALGTKIESLTSLMNGESFKALDDAEHAGMINQLEAMKKYASILSDRIHYANHKEPPIDGNVAGPCWVRDALRILYEESRKAI